MALNDSQKWLFLTALIVSGLLLYVLSPILTPFVAAALLAYLGDPLVDRLEARKLSRTVSVVVVFSIMFTVLTLAVLLLAPIVQAQILGLIKKLPQYLEWVNLHVMPWVRESLGVQTQPDLNRIKTLLAANWQEAGSFAGNLLGYVTRSGAMLAGWLANLLLIPVVTFYMLRDWDVFVAYVRDMLPRNLEPTVSKLASESDEMLGAFLRGQLLVMMALSAVYSLGLWLIGLEFALLIGLLAGFVSFVPYLGFIVGVVVAGIAMFFQTHELLPVLLVYAVFGVGQMFEGMLLTPLLVGDRIGLHPVAVIFAVLAGGQLFGFFGVLLALPAAAVLAVLLRHMHRRYKGSQLYTPPAADLPGGD